jgi:hypothetical protein
MSVVIVRYTCKQERADENQALIENVFAALDASRPPGLAYASYRLADGVSFVHVAEVATDDGTNPLTGTPAFAEFLRDIGDRCEERPVAADATLVGSYRALPDGEMRSGG